MPNLDKDFYLDKQGLRQLINELETNIVALEYDTTVSYSVGDYCVYENNLYRCITATTGVWDSTAWVKVVISDEIPSIKSITTAQWEALTPAQKASGDYVITDATTVPLTAENVPYDDTVSGLTADNVQDAIDELASGGGSGSGIYSVIGTQTAATSAWTGVLHGVSALYDGLTINYYVPQNSVINTNVTLNLTLDSGSTTGAIGVYRNGGMQYTYGYNAGNSVILTYFSAGSISINGTATLVDMWINDAYVNDKAEQKPTNSENVNFPIALSLAFGRRATEAVYSDYPNFTYNPSTQNLAVPTVNGYTPTGVWVGTQAEYNAIATPDPNTTYYITDGQTAPTPNAGTIGYDNTESGLSAHTVQAAIDEVTAELSEWRDFQYNTEKAVGFTYVSGVKKVVYHQILLSEASSTTAWGAKMTNLPFTGPNVIKASFLVASSSNNKYGPYYVSASDMFRAGIETTNLMAQFGTSYPALPARVIADVYYTK